ncbi:MAG: 5'-3' exonuclease H3TH domain-containing protein [Microgenomates group bacterium]
MSKLVLIDGNAILHRAYHALPPLTTKKREPINAVYGFISMLLRVIQDLKPTHMAVAFDRKEPTFRHEEYEAYQAHRPEADKELISQFEKAREAISAFGIPIYDKAGYEADDVIGTLAKQAEKKLEEIVIVTGDRDILQLVTDKTKVYLPIRGLSDAKLMGEEDVVEKMGVKPEQIDDYKALVGDPSDNYPGVPGIGPKTATKLLLEHGTVENIYKNLGKILESTAKKLKEGEDLAKISQRLAEIVTNVPVKLDIEDADDWGIGRKEVLDLFTKFGFKALAKRVKKVAEEMEKEKQMQLL